LISLKSNYPVLCVFLTAVEHI